MLERAGRPLRRHRGPAMGDAVNLAARMEQTAAAGTIQISEDTYSHVAPLFETEALGEVRVKGKSRPVPSYRVRGRKAVPGRLRGICSYSPGITIYPDISQ